MNTTAGYVIAPSKDGIKAVDAKRLCESYNVVSYLSTLATIDEHEAVKEAFLGEHGGKVRDGGNGQMLQAQLQQKWKGLHYDCMIIPFIFD